MRNTLALILVVALALGALPVAAQETPAPALPSPLATPEPAEAAVSPSAYTVGQCSNVTREQLRDELEAAALGVLNSGSSTLNVQSVVDRQWQALGLDAVMEQEVARAVDALATDTGYWERFLSGWSAAKAEEFASAVANDAFDSPAFHAAIERLADAVAGEIARSVNAELTKAASAAFLCLREYVGARYSETLFRAFETSVSQAISATPIEIDATAAISSPLTGHMAGLTGASIIVVTEIGRRVGAKIGQKLAGRVAGKVVGRVVGRAGSSLVPIAGWVIGIALIAWDIYEGMQGALPQIEEALAGEEVMARVRAEVADAVRASTPEETSIAALETAAAMLDAWESFCSEYGDVCALSAGNPAFNAILQDAPLSELNRIAALESAFSDGLGRDELERALETGAFDRLLDAPPAATQILTATRSVEETLGWIDLAGDDLDDVASIGMHLYTDAEDLDGVRFALLLAMNDGVAVRRFLALGALTRSRLWNMPPETVRDLVNTLPQEELATLGEAMLQPWVTATPPAVIARALLAGATTVVQLAATPVGQSAAPSPAGMSQQAESTAAAGESAALTTTGEPAQEVANTQGVGIDWSTLIMLALIVALLAIIVFLLWSRRASRR